jgi:hypothetical protein
MLEYSLLFTVLSFNPLGRPSLVHFGLFFDETVIYNIFFFWFF